MKVSVEYESKELILNPMIGVALFRDDGLYTYGTNTRGIKSWKYTRNRTCGGLFYDINLMRGTYFVTIVLRDCE